MFLVYINTTLLLTICGADNKIDRLRDIYVSSGQRPTPRSSKLSLINGELLTAIKWLDMNWISQLSLEIPSEY